MWSLWCAVGWVRLCMYGLYIRSTPHDDRRAVPRWRPHTTWAWYNDDWPLLIERHLQRPFQIEAFACALYVSLNWERQVVVVPRRGGDEVVRGTACLSPCGLYALVWSFSLYSTHDHPIFLAPPPSRTPHDDRHGVHPGQATPPGPGTTTTRCTCSKTLRPHAFCRRRTGARWCCSRG